MQTKQEKTSTPAVATKSEYTGPTDIDDLSLHTQLKADTVIVKK